MVMRQRIRRGIITEDVGIKKGMNGQGNRDKQETANQKKGNG